MQRKEDLLLCLHHSQKQSQNQNVSFLPCSPSLVQAGSGEASQITCMLCKLFFFSRKGEMIQEETK